MARYDYVIAGSGIAGLYTALMARQHGSVLVITKGSIEDCNTRFAQGGIAAPISKEDSAELQNFIEISGDLCSGSEPFSDAHFDPSARERIEAQRVRVLT